MSKTETRHLIEQAIRELQLDGTKVRASVVKPGTYEVYREVIDAEIPMDCEYKTIIAALKGSGREGP